MKKLVKRACDSCIARKVRCDGAWPCETCETSARRLPCTYDRPAQKRGPKIRRQSMKHQTNDSKHGNEASIQPVSSHGVENLQHEQHEIEQSVQQVPIPEQDPLGFQITASLHLKEALSRVVNEYKTQSYGVWPIIRSDVLLEQLSSPLLEEPSVYGLATALCAATMSQLDMDPLVCCVGDESVVIDGSYLSKECIHIREQYQYREHLDIRWVLASFFLHVYNAKIDKRNSALIFVQEALTSARLLGLDQNSQALQLSAAWQVVDNGEIIFPLLWVTERGYSMHLGLTSSSFYNTPLQLMEPIIENAHVKGMIALAGLFVTFDQCIKDYTNKDTLVESERLLRESEISSEDVDATRLADLSITKEWMRTMIWQNGLSAGYLSFDSQATSLSFTFPVVIGRDLLSALRGFSSEDLLPLGRDQLLKCYEVANTLADTLLCNPALSEQSTLQFGPYDFLHGIYMKILPFLHSDDALNSILREKTAETLLRAPSRLRTLSLPYLWEDDTPVQTNPIASWFD